MFGWGPLSPSWCWCVSVWECGPIPAFLPTLPAFQPIRVAGNRPHVHLPLPLQCYRRHPACLASHIPRAPRIIRTHTPSRSRGIFSQPRVQPKSRNCCEFCRHLESTMEREMHIFDLQNICTRKEKIETMQCHQCEIFITPSKEFLLWHILHFVDSRIALDLFDIHRWLGTQ